MESNEKSFAVKHSFFFLSVLSVIFMLLPGILETNEGVRIFQQSNGYVTFIIWFSIFLGAIMFLYSKELKSFFTKEKVFLRTLKALASLKFTVFMLGVSVWLVFVGTLAQEEFGIWEVVDEYFRCFFAQVKISHMLPGEVSESVQRIHYYYPGGYVIGGCLLVNLLTAHGLKFKVSSTGNTRVIGVIIVAAGLFFIYWAIADGMSREDIPSAYVDSYKRVLYRLLVGLGSSSVLLIGCWLLFKKRAGIVILHFGIILLLFSELITGFYQVEGNLSIQEGKSSSFIDVSRSFELAISEPGLADGSETSIVIPDNFLKKVGEWQRLEGVPFEFEVNQWYSNSNIDQRTTSSEDYAELGKRYKIEAAKEATGMQSSVDIPSTEIEFRGKDGKELGKYIFSVWMYLDRNPLLNQKIKVADKEYELIFRNKREYLYSKDSTEPVQIRLIDFRHDTYLGTNVPKNYSSLVQLTDKANEIDRKVLISMNNPLRYTGRTFYQSSFAPDETGTVLQVVRNPGWMIPYLCCVIVGMGLFFQFILTLIKFTNKKLAS